jgi:tetratricopeptide (TPR) repeat protein
MNNLAVCIVITDEDDLAQINNSIDSLSGLDFGLFVIDITNKFKDLRATILKPVSEEDMSDNKNSFFKLDYKWFLFLDPQDVLVNGKNYILDISLQDHGVYKVLLLNNGVLTKSVRLVSKNHGVFENPIYENIFSSNSKHTNILIESKDKNIKDEIIKIEKWKNKNKFNSIPLYYESCYYLKNQDYKKFISTADKYLFIEKNSDLPSYIMLKYYQAFVYFYHLDDITKSFQNLIFCIEKNPTLAEFWCLLGDINFELKKYKKAYYYYDNATILGKSRNKSDDLFIDIKKYEIYPEKMKNKCKELVENI